MANLRALQDWSGPPAILTLWRPSAESMERARCAPVSAIPPSYEQEQHLRGYRACELRHWEMGRLVIVVWEETGRCDLRAMSHVVTAHLRRHDTYHSWFEERGDAIVRHVLADPESIQMEPVTIGEVAAEDWQRHVAGTPSPFVWDCFRFGILQRARGFTCFACIDHLHADSTVIAFMMEEIHGAYRAILDGETPARSTAEGRYLDYCSIQRQRTAKMTLADPEVTEWVAFLGRNHWRMPSFSMPLDITEDRCLAEYINVDILDDATMTAFESACHVAGARVIGGLLACAALAERNLTGAKRYTVVTPTTTRKSPESYRTTGWCMGVVPIDFEIGEQTFADLAVTAQRIFDGRLTLTNVPIERILELAAELSKVPPVATGGVMLSLMDVSLPPLGAHIAREWSRSNGRVYINQGAAAQVGLWFFRTEHGLSLTAAYPANATARASLRGYIDALKIECQRAAVARVPAPRRLGPSL